MNARRQGLVRWMKFNAVGAIGICVQLGVLAGLQSGLGMNYLLLHNFFWHERFTWADRRLGATARRLWKFNFTTGVFSLAGNVILTKLLVDAGAGYLAANASAIVLCSIVNFFVNDRVVFIAPK